MPNRVWIVTASIYILENIWSFYVRGDLEEVEKVIVVDEGDELIRSKSRELLRDLNVEFHGPKERENFFRNRYGSSYEKYLSLIPERSHAETSYGFLLAYEAGVDYVLELDDDVYPENGFSLVKDHISNLRSASGKYVESPGRWINTIDFLVLDPRIDLFPRGHPYDPSTRIRSYRFRDVDGECVLNMGLWTGHPDLDALTILYLGGLDGRARVSSISITEKRVIPARGNYFAVCSMNTSFSRKIIPAFYQLYMRYMGIDRFDDIWSGIFLKKIADRIGDLMCIGSPAARHVKRPRSVWKDLRAELEGMIINETLWKIVDQAEIDSKNYADGYIELADYIAKRLGEFREELHRKFLEAQIYRMRLWVEALDKLG